MDDTNKMLRTIINGQSALKQEILGEIRKVDKKVDEVKVALKKTEERLTRRIDRLGSDLANLQDDAPTVDEFDDLNKRVKKLEGQIIKN
jgi:hypothetical protein